jgi:hypothetical protein
MEQIYALILTTSGYAVSTYENFLEYGNCICCETSYDRDELEDKATERNHEYLLLIMQDKF